MSRWFGRSGKEPTKVAIPLRAQVESIYVVYFTATQAGPPSDQALVEAIDAYFAERLPPRLIPAASAYRQSTLFSVKYVPVDRLPSPPLALLRYGKMTELQERIIAGAQQAVLVRGSDINMAPRIGLWATLAAGLAVRRLLDGALFDPDALRIVHQDRAEGWFTDTGAIAVAHHVIVPFSIGDRGLGWMTTRGLGKFGLPDLEVRDVPPNLNSLNMLMNAVGQVLVEAGLREVEERNLAASELTVPAELTIDRSIAARAHSERPKEPSTDTVAVPIGIQFRPADRAPEPSMVRLVPPRSFGNDTGVWLSDSLNKLVGSDDLIRMARTSGDAMQRAHERAMSELPAAKRRFEAGLRPGEVLYVKHGFPTPSKSAEFMWLVVNRWEGTRLVGQLASEPREVPSLRLGQTVTLGEADLFDWMIRLPDDRQEGGYTSDVALQEGDS